MKNKNDMKLIMERWNRYAIQENEQTSAESKPDWFPEIHQAYLEFKRQSQTGGATNEGIGDFVKGVKGKFGKLGQAAALATALAGAFGGGTAHAAEPTHSGVQTTQVQQGQEQAPVSRFQGKINSDKAKVFLGVIEDFIRHLDSPIERMNATSDLAKLLDALADIAHGATNARPLPADADDFLGGVQAKATGVTDAQLLRWMEIGANYQINTVGM